MSEIVDIIAYRNSAHFPVVVILLCVSFFIIYRLKGRAWSFLYLLIIPFLNWSFGTVPEVQLFDPGRFNAQGIALHPMTMVTGLVFVIRDFAQREISHRILLVMAMAIAWSFYYSWPVIALASGIAFAISETVDWVLFTFSKYRLSTRILLSSALAAPIDTTVFLYGADLAMQGQGEPAGSMLHVANWGVFVVGKMIGAVAVSWLVRRREASGHLAAYEQG